MEIRIENAQGETEDLGSVINEVSTYCPVNISCATQFSPEKPSTERIQPAEYALVTII